MKILKKRENAMLEPRYKVIFSTFVLLRLLKSDPSLGFNNKKQKCSLSIFNKCQKRFLHQNYLWMLKFQQQKKVFFYNFRILFLYSVRVRGEVVSRGKFDADQRIFKHC
jgi:hypothetical protein